MSLRGWNARRCVIIFNSGDSANTSGNKRRAGGWVDPKALLHIDSQRPMTSMVFWNESSYGLVKVYQSFEGNQIIWRHIKGHRLKNGNLTKENELYYNT